SSNPPPSAIQAHAGHKGARLLALRWRRRGTGCRARLAPKEATVRTNPSKTANRGDPNLVHKRQRTNYRVEKNCNIPAVHHLASFVMWRLDARRIGTGCHARSRCRVRDLGA
ncbi:MAG: hypothetical protein AAEI08_08835, partial [Gammaproteobacteria bacterium]